MVPFTQANLDWILFSYNTPKSNESTSLLHWDNFGFDAPANFTSKIETHNYIDGNVGTANFKNYSTSDPYHSVVKIQDQISSALSARLMYTQQMQGNGLFKWSAGDNVKINNKTYSLPNPLSIPHYAGIMPSGLVPLTFIIPLNLSDIVQGNNSIDMFPSYSGLLNVHIELDFNRNSAPSFTQPINI